VEGSERRSVGASERESGQTVQGVIIMKPEIRKKSEGRNPKGPVVLDPSYRQSLEAHTSMLRASDFGKQLRDCSVSELRSEICCEEANTREEMHER